MGCPLSFSLLFTYCSWEVTEQIRRAVLTPERTHPHSSGLFLLFSIFQTPAFLLITCKFKCIKHLKISRNTEVQDNILMPWKPSKYGDYLNLEGSWLTFRSASPKRNAPGSNPGKRAKKCRKHCVFGTFTFYFSIIFLEWVLLFLGSKSKSNFYRSPT